MSPTSFLYTITQFSVHFPSLHPLLGPLLQLQPLAQLLLLFPFRLLHPSLLFFLLPLLFFLLNLSQHGAQCLLNGISALPHQSSEFKTVLSPLTCSLFPNSFGGPSSWSASLSPSSHSKSASRAIFSNH